MTNIFDDNYSEHCRLVEAKKSEPRLCGVCRNVEITGKADACAKCIEGLEDERAAPTRPRDSYAKPTPRTVSADDVSRILNYFNRLPLGTKVSLVEISKKTRVSRNDAHKILTEKLKHLIKRVGNKYTLKGIHENLGDSVSAILDGSVVVNEIERLLDVVHD